MRKSEIDKEVFDVTGEIVNLRPAVRSLLKEQKIASVVVNGSKKYTFLARQEWVDITSSPFQLFERYRQALDMEIKFHIEKIEIKFTMEEDNVVIAE